MFPESVPAFFNPAKQLSKLPRKRSADKETKIMLNVRSVKGRHFVNGCESKLADVFKIVKKNQKKFQRHNIYQYYYLSFVS